MQDLQDFCAVHRATMCSAATFAMGTYLDPPPCNEVWPLAMEHIHMSFLWLYRWKALCLSMSNMSLHFTPGRCFSLLDASVVPGTGKSLILWFITHSKSFSTSAWPPHNKHATSLSTWKKEQNATSSSCRWTIYCRHSVMMIVFARKTAMLLLIGRAGWNINLHPAHPAHPAAITY